MAYLPPLNGGRVNVQPGGNTAGVTTVVSNGTLTLAGGNNVTLSQNGSAITISGAAASAVNANDSLGMSNLGNTSGTTGMATGTAMQFVFAGGNNITLSQSINNNSGTITISGPAASALNANDSLGMSNLGNTSGTTGMATGTAMQFVYAGGNNMTLSQSISSNSGTITFSAASQSNPNLSMYAIGNTTNNNSTLLNASNLSVSGVGGASVGYNAGALEVSAPIGQTLSYFEPYPMHNTGTATLSATTNATSGPASFIPFIIPNNVAAGYINMVKSMSMITGGFAALSQTVTVNFGLYTRGTGANSTTLSQITSNSFSHALSYSNSTMTISQPTSTGTAGYSYGSTSSAGLALSSQYTGLKMMQMLITSVLTPGQYWLGIQDRYSTVGGNSGLMHSYYGNAHTMTDMAPMGQLSSAYTTGTNLYLGIGHWNVGFGSYVSAGQSVLPSTLAIQSMTQNLTAIPYMKMVVS